MAADKYFSILLLLVMITISQGCENDATEVLDMTKETKEIEVAKDIIANFSQGGKMKAVLEAPLMYRVKSDTVYTEFPKSVLVTFYNETGTVDNIVKAKYARYYELLRKVYLKDNVVAYNIKGDTLFAQDLWWDQNEAVFYSNNPVRIRTLTQKLKGSGITAKSDFSKYTILNPVGDVAIPPEINR